MTEEAQVPISPEDQQAVAKSVQEMMEKPAYQKVLGAMIAFRQGYVMAYNDIERLTSKEADTHELAIDALVQSAAYAASKPFDEKELFQGFQETVFPWMVETIQRHEGEDTSKLQADLEKDEEERRDTLVPVGVKYDPSKDAVLTRLDSMVLVGWGPAVRWLLDHAVSQTLVGRDTDVFSVIRFSLNKKRIRFSFNRRLLTLNASEWDEACKSNAELPRRAKKYIAPRLAEKFGSKEKQPPDLVVVDHLPHAYREMGMSPDVATDINTGRPAARAHKILRKWANDLGAAFIGGVCLESQERPNLEDPSWETIKIFSFLRPVSVFAEADNLDEDKYRILVGRNACYFDVDKEILDTYGEGSTLLPDKEIIE